MERIIQMNNIISHLIRHYISPLYIVSHKLHETSIVANKTYGNIPDNKTFCLLKKIKRQLKLSRGKYVRLQELYNLTKLQLNYHGSSSLYENICILQNLQLIYIDKNKEYIIGRDIRLNKRIQIEISV